MRRNFLFFPFSSSRHLSFCLPHYDDLTHVLWEEEERDRTHKRSEEQYLRRFVYFFSLLLLFPSLFPSFFRSRSLSRFLSLVLSLSPVLSRTHTHTHKPVRERGGRKMSSLSAFVGEVLSLETHTETSTGDITETSRHKRDIKTHKRHQDTKKTSKLSMSQKVITETSKRHQRDIKETSRHKR